MSKINKIPFLLFITLITISTFNCGGIKPASSGKISKYVEDFFIGDGKMQYFVQPLDYVSNLEEDATLDATFRRSEEKNDSVTVNFSVLLKNNNYIKKVIIKSSEGEYPTEEVKTFFTEKSDEKIKHRASIKMAYVDYEKHLLKENHSINASSKDETITITPTKKSKQKFEHIIAILSDLL